MGLPIVLRSKVIVLMKLHQQLMVPHTILSNVRSKQAIIHALAFATRPDISILGLNNYTDSTPESRDQNTYACHPTPFVSVVLELRREMPAEVSPPAQKYRFSELPAEDLQIRELESPM
jgi:hypothetical protein